eukprot:6174879-Pleurochrysis_carterae.AAC.4
MDVLQFRMRSISHSISQPCGVNIKSNLQNTVIMAAKKCHFVSNISNSKTNGSRSLRLLSVLYRIVDFANT